MICWSQVRVHLTKLPKLRLGCSSVNKPFDRSPSRLREAFIGQAASGIIGSLITPTPPEEGGGDAPTCRQELSHEYL